MDHWANAHLLRQEEINMRRRLYLFTLGLSIAVYSGVYRHAMDVHAQLDGMTLLGLSASEYRPFDTAKFGSGLVWLTDDWLLTTKRNSLGVYDAVTNKLLAYREWEYDEDKEWYLDESNRKMPLLVDPVLGFLADNGSRLVTYHGNGVIRIWTTRDWALEKTIESDLFRKRDFRVRLTPDKRYIYAILEYTNKKGRTGFLDWRTGKLVNLGAPRCVLGFSRSGNYALALEDGVLEVYSYPDWRQVAQTRALQRYGVSNYLDSPVICFGVSDEELFIARSWGERKDWFLCVYNWAKDKEVRYCTGEQFISWPQFYATTQYTPPPIIGDRLALFKTRKPGENRSPGWMLWDFKRLFPALEYTLPEPWSMGHFLVSPNAKRVYFYIHTPEFKEVKTFVGVVPADWHLAAAHLKDIND
jgi:hypothetical protein